MAGQKFLERYGGQTTEELLALEREYRIDSPERMVEAVHPDNEAVLEALGPRDDRYFSNDEPIADRLFEWIRQNRAFILVGRK